MVEVIGKTTRETPTRKALVVEAIQNAGSRGCTSVEVARTTEISVKDVATIFSVLRADGLIVKTAKTRKSASSGRPAVVYRWKPSYKEEGPNESWRSMTFGDLFEFTKETGVNISRVGLTWEANLCNSRRITDPLFSRVLEKLAERIRKETK